MKHPSETIFFNWFYRSISLFCLLLLATPTLNAQWKQCNYLFDAPIKAFAVCGTTLFAGNWTSGLYRSMDNGDSWTLVTNGMENHLILSLAVKGTVIFAGTAKGVYRSYDNGNNWQKASNGLKDAGVLCLAAYGTSVYAGIDGEGVFRSDDNGGTWTKIMSHSYVRSILIFNDNLYVGVWYQIYISRDNGNKWVNVKINEKQLTVTHFRVVGENIFALARYDGTQDGIYRSNNAGFNWIETDNGLTSKRKARCLTVINETLYAGTEDNGIFRSADNGNNWGEMNVGLSSSARFIYALVGSETTLFAGADDRHIWKYENATTVSETQEPQPQELTLTPNPVSTSFTVSGMDNVSSVNIVNTMGIDVNVQWQGRGTREFDISNLANGVYFIQFRTQAGIVSKPFVVSH